MRERRHNLAQRLVGEGRETVRECHGLLFVLHRVVLQAQHGVRGALKVVEAPQLQHAGDVHGDVLELEELLGGELPVDTTDAAPVVLRGGSERGGGTEHGLNKCFLVDHGGKPSL